MIQIVSLFVVLLCSIAFSHSSHAIPICEAHAVQPTYQEGSQVPCSVDLNGNMRSSAQGDPTMTTTVASGVATNTTTSAVTVPTGPKSFYGQVTCSSSTCTQTQAIFGNQSSSTSTGILLCTLTLSAASPSAQDACPVITANFAFYYVTTTNTGGGGTPTGAVYAMY